MSAFDSGRSLVKQYEGKPFALIGVNSDYEIEDAREIKKQAGLTWPSFFDEQQQISSVYGILGYPTVIVIDANGKIQWIGHEHPESLIAQMVADAG